MAQRVTGTRDDRVEALDEMSSWVDDESDPEGHGSAPVTGEPMPDGPARTDLEVVTEADDRIFPADAGWGAVIALAVCLLITVFALFARGL